jgi:hypothetical protein
MTLRGTSARGGFPAVSPAFGPDQQIFGVNQQDRRRVRLLLQKHRQRRFFHRAPWSIPLPINARTKAFGTPNELTRTVRLSAAPRARARTPCSTKPYVIWHVLMSLSSGRE